MSRASQRSLKVMVALFAFVGIIRPLVAQAPGDSVRLRLSPDASWQMGRLVERDSGRLVLRQSMRDQRYQLTTIERVDVWKRENAPLMVLGGAVAGIAGVLLNRAISPDRQPVTGSRAGDFAAFGGGGAFIGVVYLLIHPGGWHKIRLGR